jgi:predicted amidophosphoribosyltransferase
MQSSRRCSACGAPLSVDGNERCTQCRPALSRQAQLVGVARRRERQAIEQVERDIGNLEMLLRRINRNLK